MSDTALSEHKIINKTTEQLKAINVCCICNKKLSMLEFNMNKCKCSNLNRFCKSHLIPNTHACKFDYFEENKKKILLQNPKIVNTKVEAI